MDSILLLSWLAYLVCALLLLFASWKLLGWLPFSLKSSIFLSQLAVLLIPAQVMNGAMAPAFIVVILDILSGVPTAEWIESALPLFLALIAAWPLGFAWAWVVRKREDKQQYEEEDVNP